MTKRKHKLSQFGKELRKLRVDMDESSTDMARKLSTAVSYLNKLEIAHTRVSSGMLAKLFQAYSMPSKRQRAFEEAAALANASWSPPTDIKGGASTPEQAELAKAFLEELPHLDDGDCLALKELLAECRNFRTML